MGFDVWLAPSGCELHLVLLAVVEAIVGASALPEREHYDGEFACDGDLRFLLFGPRSRADLRESPATNIAVHAERTEDVRGAVGEERPHIGVPGFGDPHLGGVVAGVFAPSAESEIGAEITGVGEARRVTDDCGEVECGECADAGYLGEM